MRNETIARAVPSLTQYIAVIVAASIPLRAARTNIHTQAMQRGGALIDDESRVRVQTTGGDGLHDRVADDIKFRTLLVPAASATVFAKTPQVVHT